MQLTLHRKTAAQRLSLFHAWSLPENVSGIPLRVSEQSLQIVHLIRMKLLCRPIKHIPNYMTLT